VERLGIAARCTDEDPVLHPVGPAQVAACHAVGERVEG
jgi:hypothetical protein